MRMSIAWYKRGMLSCARWYPCAIAFSEAACNLRYSSTLLWFPANAYPIAIELGSAK